MTAVLFQPFCRFQQDPMTIRSLGLNFLLDEGDKRENNKIKNLTLNNKCSQDKFSVHLDLKDFKPEEVTVKCSGSSLQIHALHSEEDESSDYLIRHEIKRKINIPNDVEIEKITSAFHSNGLLTIEGPRKLSNNIRTVPILIEKELSKSENVELLEEPSESTEKNAENGLSQNSNSGI